jgi:very-short-patch-repair endonuclease
LWIELRPLKQLGFHFRRQARLGPYIVDFACHAMKLIVELDGSQHGEESNIRYDIRRTSFLESRGYRVIRFWNSEVIESRSAVVEAILRALEVPPTLRPGVPRRNADLPARGR